MWWKRPACRLRLLRYQEVEYNQVARECSLGVARTHNVAQIAVLAGKTEAAGPDVQVCVCNSHLFWNPALAFVKTLQVRSRAHPRAAP